MEWILKSGNLGTGSTPEAVFFSRSHGTTSMKERKENFFMVMKRTRILSQLIYLPATALPDERDWHGPQIFMFIENQIWSNREKHCQTWSNPVRCCVSNKTRSVCCSYCYPMLNLSCRRIRRADAPSPSVFFFP